MKKATLLLAHLFARRACLWAALCLAFLLTTVAHPAQAAVTEAWVHRYNTVVSNSNDQAFKVVRDAAGDIIVTGTTDDGITGRDMLTIKYSGADGSVLWQQRYNGPGNYDDRANAVAVDGSGNVVVTGYSVTVKYAAADGALLWANGGGQAVAVDGSGNVVVTGTSYGTNSNYDYYTAKYAAADGTLLWEQRYNGPGNYDDRANAVAVDGSGYVVVTGTSQNGAQNYDFDYYTAKYAAADGALLWEKRYNGQANGWDQAQAVAVDGSGNVVVTGSSGNASNLDYYTAKYAAANGALLWEQRYNGPANSTDQAQALAVDSSGNVVVMGYSSGTNGYEDSYTAKYAAADGALLWEQRYNGPVNYYDSASEVAVDSSGNVVVMGSFWNASNLDYYTAKYAAANGALLWEKRYNGPVNYYSAVAVDGSGNVVVTGSSVGSGSNFDYYTAKYAAADGALLWEQRYNGLSKSYNEAKAVVVDGSGNVLVTGYSEGNGSGSDYYTAKYAAGDGALLWEQRYNGPANRDDQAQAVAVDGSGNVLVTGYSSGTNGYANSYTAKYAAADGALLWEKRYNSPVSYYNSASAVAVDSSGNVVVTGYSYGTNGYSPDSYTAKYAAADGALLWEKRYNDPVNYDNYSPAVAVDGSGNVVVTGSSSSGTSTDYYTAKYAAADGALLWEKRYNSPANGEDYARAVAVDGSGNVLVTGVTDASFPLCDDYEGDYYTAKYAVADGALLWEKRYHSLVNSYEEATALAVDSSGNVVVTGNSATIKYLADGTGVWTNNIGGAALAVDGSGNVVVTGSSWNGSSADYYTAKYAAADGALLWEKRYNGPVNGDHRVAGLALGPNGMVAVTGSSSGDYATVVYRENLPPVSIALVPAGIRLRFTGVHGRSYTIERAPAVTGPWTTLNTQTAPASGLLEYIDDPPAGSAFYRTAQP